MEGRKGSKEMTRKSFIIALVIIAALVTGMFVLMAAEENRQTWDTEHPLVNSNISWEQTWYKGAWSDAG